MTDTNPLADVLSIDPVNGIVTKLAVVEQGNLIMPLNDPEEAVELLRTACMTMNGNLVTDAEPFVDMRGFKISLGDEVRFSTSGANGYGTVIGIRGDKIRILPDDTRTFYSERGRYTLNERSAARHPFPDFNAVRDNGVSGGCIMRPHDGWAEPAAFEWA